MNQSKKLAIHIVGVNFFGFLAAAAAYMIAGLFEALVVFPFATIVAAFIVHSKYKHKDGGDSSNDEEERLIVLED